MTAYTWEEIIEHRKAWIDYLKRPETKKAFGILEDKYNNEERCCLGHACHVMGAERTISEETGKIFYYGNASTVSIEVQEYFGLWDDVGNFSRISGKSLALLNDVTDATPQDIGKYLESVIEGGDQTPFKSKENYTK